MGVVSPTTKPVGCPYLDVSPKIYDAEKPDRTVLFKRQSRRSSKQGTLLRYLRVQLVQTTQEPQLHGMSSIPLFLMCLHSCPGR